MQTLLCGSEANMDIKERRLKALGESHSPLKKLISQLTAVSVYFFLLKKIKYVDRTFKIL